MKKLYFIACAALCASMAAAAPIPQRGGAKPLQKPELRRETPVRHAPTRAEYSVITEVPGTPEAKNFNCTYFDPWYGDMTYGDYPHNVAVDGNDVYLQDIVGGIVFDTWAKGVKEGDAITLSLPQAVYYQDLYDEYVLLCVLKSDGNGGYVYDEETTEATLEISGDGFWTLDLGNSIDEENPEYILGLAWESDMTWIETYGDSWFEVGDLLYQKDPIPGDVAMEEWAITDTYYADMCKVGIKDNTVYIQGLYPDYSEAFVEGTIEDGHVVIKPQFMGIDYSYYLFFDPCEIDEDWNITGEIEAALAVYDAENKRMEALDNEVWFLCTSELGVDDGFIDYLEQARIFFQNPEDLNADPIDPEFYTYMEYDPTYGYGGLSWLISPLNVNGFVLPEKDLYINLFLNGEPWPLTPDVTGLDEDMYDIPFDYNSPYEDFICTGNQLVYYLYEPFDTEVESLGCQIVYKGADGVVYKSQLVTEQIAGIAEIGDKEVKGESFIDFTGKSVSNPAPGLYIKTTVFSDGSRKTEKTVVR